ncbi:hypothetical protein IJM16_00780 [Candidatus Saccharibacteria bacterium]|nr:hypothetical protein [Candidatus Saccharibacteria bacterium]
MNNLHKKITLLIGITFATLLVAFCGDNTAFAWSDEGKSACETGGGYMKVSSEILNNSFKGLAGGSDYGMEWVCKDADNRKARKGTLFIATKVTGEVKVKEQKKTKKKAFKHAKIEYTIYPDIELSSGATTNVMMAGMVHTSQGLTMTNYAAQLGVCVSATVNDASSCSQGSLAPIKLKDGNTYNIFNSLPTTGGEYYKVQRMENSTYAVPLVQQGNWARPFTCWTTVSPSGRWMKTGGDVGTVSECTETNASINNNVLKRAIDENYSLPENQKKLEISTVAVNGKTYSKVRLYLHHQWSPNGTANVSTIYILVKYTPQPDGWETTFDGAVSNNVDSIAGLTWDANEKLYYTNNESTKVKFIHQIKRTGGGPSTGVYLNWNSYFDSSHNTTTAKAHGPTSLTISSNWTTAVDWHEKEFKLGYGEKDTYCEALSYVTKVTNNGSTNTDGAYVSPMKESCVTIKRRDQTHSFTASVTPTVTIGGVNQSPTVAGGDRYNTDSDKVTVKFTYKVCRTDKIDPTKQKSSWKTFRVGKGSVDENSTATKSGTDEVEKEKCVEVDGTDERKDQKLTAGQDKTFCGTIGWHKNVKDSGATSDWGEADSCVTVHRYAWYEMEAQVVPSTNATLRDDGAYWTDSNSANLYYAFQFHSKASTGIKPKYKTSKNPNPGNDFRVLSNYTQSTTALKDSDGWKTLYDSPKTNPASVFVAKDDGSKYCQTLNYYKKVREDSNDYNTEGSIEKCLNFKRYKTTFSGNTVIYINNDTSTNYDNGTFSLQSKDYSSYPVDVTVSFVHTVTRNEDADGSPAEKSSRISTNIFDGTDTYGYRANDKHGTARAAADTEALAPGESATHTDTFTTKLYPDQTIVLCQQMTYRSEIQGADNTKNDTKGNKACVTLKMDELTCMDGKKTIGIHNGTNYLQVDIYKNNSTTANKTSGIKSEGDTTITAWAKPGDQIRYNYLACAGGDLAQQYDVKNSKTTSYKIKANATGYLFGDEINASPYTEAEKEVGRSSETVGVGPFNEDYTLTATSPHGESIYSCNFYGTNGIADFYRIPAYIEGLTQSNYRDACKSDDYGRVNDLGTTITQTSTWTDIRYSNGGPVNDHNGATAKIIANVKIPYNYKTDIDTSGDGGYIIPGMPHTEKIVLNIEPRRNTPVNGANNYSTVTKPTKYRLIEIIIDEDRTETSEYFNGLVNNNEYFSDEYGNRNLSTDLAVCEHFRDSCTIVKSGEGKRYDPRNNSTTGQELDSYSRTIPYDSKPGLKYCYVSAVWPSDSHNLPTADDLTEAQNAAGMTEGGNQWHVSGATCYTVAKRPSVHILGGDAYAQGYISARVQKYPSNNNGDNPRIYGSWSEYAAISGLSLKGFASGATLWGGSNIVANAGDTVRSCSFSAYTFANAECKDDKLGNFGIDTTTSSNPETIANQIMTRYTRTDRTGEMNPTNSSPIPVKDGGICEYDDTDNTYKPKDKEAGATFACIGDTGAKYTHVKNKNGPVAYIPNDTNYCMIKGDTNSNRTSIIHADGTLIIGTNIVYGNTRQQYVGQGTTDAGMCYEDQYNSISEIPQSIMIAKKIIIKGNVKHIDSWLIADEIITCDPSSRWRGDVPITDINSNNCTTQLTVNGPVMTKNLKLYRTYGTGFTYDFWGNKINTKASPAEIFTMGPETYLWSFNQAQRYSQATTTYARELAPRY